jgi:hypothetical protein
LRISCRADRSYFPTFPGIQAQLLVKALGAYADAQPEICLAADSGSKDRRHCSLRSLTASFDGPLQQNARVIQATSVR